MSSIDIIFAAFLGFFVILGVFKGFFREILGFAGILGGIFFSIIGFGPLSAVLINRFPDIPGIVWSVVSFIIIFSAVYVLSRVLANLLSRLSQKIYLGWLNRLLGGTIGGLKGALIISFVLLIIGFLPVQSTLNNIRNNSGLYDPLQKLLPTLYDFTTSLSTSSKDFEKKLKKSLDEGKVKATKEMTRYLFKGNQDSSNDD